MNFFSTSPTTYIDSGASALEFRGAELRLIAFSPSTLDPVRLEIDLREKVGNDKHFLFGEQIVLDFSSLPDTPTVTEVLALVALLGQFNLKLVAAHNGNEVQMEAACEAGLIVLSNETMIPQAPSYRGNEESVSTRVVERPVRTGQQIYAKNSNLVILALVSAGAEVIADGSIHVYAPLRGRALAGALGEKSARIYTTCLEAELISIAGVYRVLDEDLPSSMNSGPSQIYLKNDKLVIEALKGTH